MAGYDLDVCAHLVRIAHMFRGLGDERYYINGVRIEPLPGGGVVIVATDGYTLIALHDEDGRAPRPVTIYLRKQVRRSWGLKALAKTRLRMHLADECTDAPAEIVTLREDQREIVRAIAPAPEIDGVYPDWRKVVPGADGKEIADQGAAHLSGYLVSRFGKAANRLRWLMDPIVVPGCITLHSGGPLAPTFVRFAKGIPAFGVIMPVKEDLTVPTVPTVPEWGRRPAPEPEPEPAS